MMIDKRMRDLFAEVDEDFAFRRFDKVDRLIQATSAEPVEWAIAVLTATLARKSRLPSRPALVGGVEQALTLMGRTPELVLRGLR